MNLPNRIKDLASRLPTSGMPATDQVMARGRRRRRQRRGTAGALVTLAVVALVAVIAGAVGDIGGEDEGVVVAGEPDGARPSLTSTPATDATDDTAVVPALLAQPLSVARSRLDALGLGIEVRGGDPTFANAIVTNQEPALGAETAGTVRLRTIIPDPRERLECDGGQPPRFPVPEVPTTGAVDDRAAVEEVADTLRSQGRGDGVLVGLWQRWARRGSGDALELVPFTGYQVFVVAADRDCTSSVPALVNGVPVTTVQGPVESFGERIWRPEAGERVNIRVGVRLPTITGELVDGRRYVLASDSGLCVVLGKSYIGCSDVGPEIRPGADPAEPRFAVGPPIPDDLPPSEAGELLYAYLPPQATEVVIVADDGLTSFGGQLRTEGAVRFWAAPLTPGESLPDEVIYRNSSGEEVARFRVG